MPDSFNEAFTWDDPEGLKSKADPKIAESFHEEQRARTVCPQCRQSVVGSPDDLSAHIRDCRAAD